MMPVPVLGRLTLFSAFFCGAGSARPALTPRRPALYRAMTFTFLPILPTHARANRTVQLYRGTGRRAPGVASHNAYSTVTGHHQPLLLPPSFVYSYSMTFFSFT